MGRSFLAKAQRKSEAAEFSLIKVVLFFFAPFVLFAPLREKLSSS